MDIEEALLGNVPAPSDTLQGISVYIVTMGCAHNHADSDMIGSSLCRAGASIVPRQSDADVVYINSCTVKNPSEERAFNITSSYCANGKIVVLGGCVPQSCDSYSSDLLKHMTAGRLIITGIITSTMLEMLPQRIRVSVESIHKDVAPEIKASRVANSVEGALVPQTMHAGAIKANKGKHIGLETNIINPLSASKLSAATLACLPEYHSKPLVDVVPTSTGCMGNCTYCKTIHSRGRLASFGVESLVARVRSALDSPEVREVWFTGEDTLAWGRDSARDFSELFHHVLALFDAYDIRSDVSKRTKMIRIGMTDPESVIGKEESLARILNHPNIYKFVHLPVQSGSDYILKLMRRHYTVAQYIACIERLRQSVPGLCVDTDIICGFPYETDEHHEETLSLLRALRFEVVNVTQYYARRNTPAAVMPQINSQVKRKRTREVSDLCIGLFDRQRYIGQVHVALVAEELGIQTAERKFGGKIFNNISVSLEASADVVLAMGLYVEVEITGSSRVALIGRVLRVLSEPEIVRQIS